MVCCSITNAYIPGAWRSGLLPHLEIFSTLNLGKNAKNGQKFDPLYDFQLPPLPWSLVGAQTTLGHELPWERMQ